MTSDLQLMDTMPNPAPLPPFPADQTTALLPALWEISGDIAVALGPGFRLAAISEQGLALLGKTSAQVLGQDWLELAVAPEDREAVRRDLEALDAATDSKGQGLRDHGLLCPSGTHHLLWKAVALPPTGEHDRLLLACGQDVTAQNAALETLRQNEESYHRIFNSATDAIFVQEIPSGRFLSANDRAMALYGFTLDEFKTRTPADLSAGYPPYGTDEARELYRRAIDGRPQLFEWLARDKAGRLFWTEINLSRGIFSGQDRVIAVVRDITERKMAERALRDSEKKFRQLAEAIGEAFWLVSLDWKRVFYISPAYERLWGRTTKSLYEAPLSWLDAIHPEDRDKVLDHLTTLAGRPFRAGTFPEFRILRPDGSLRWVLSRYFPVTNDTGVTYRVAGIIEDVTARHAVREDLERLTERLEDMVRERTRTLNRMNQELIREVTERRDAEAAMAAAKEAAEAASQAKSAFLANMSHEIRTPLNGILGMAQILAGTALDDSQQGFLKDIEDSAAALLTVINDILDFSKIEADRLELVRQPFGLRGVLASVEAALDVLAREKGLGLSLDVARDVPDLLLGDADRLRQVLFNLVGNAIKFTKHGGVVIGVQCFEACQPPEAAGYHAQQELVFSVSDTGIGIRSEDTERIFDPFTQADGSYTRRFGGTGLGLAISKRLVHLMGGALGVESVPGQGSVFTFTAHFDLEAYPPELPADAPAPPQPRLPSLRVLLADDNRVHRDIIEKWLLQRGHRVVTAVDGQEALDAVIAQPFDLILMDIQMPRLGGLEAAKAIRALPDPGRAGVAIAAVTAHAMAGDRERFLEAGLDDYLAKPVVQGELDRVLAAAARRIAPPPAA